MAGSTRAASHYAGRAASTAERLARPPAKGRSSKVIPVTGSAPFLRLSSAPSLNPPWCSPERRRVCGGVFCSSLFHRHLHRHFRAFVRAWPHLWYA